MCFRARTWSNLHGIFLITMALMAVPVLLGAFQSQEAINATVHEQILYNAERLNRLELRQDKTDASLQGIRWILAMLSGQLLIEIGKWLHSRTGAGNTHPSSITERRSSDRD